MTHEKYPGHNDITEPIEVREERLTVEKRSVARGVMRVQKTVDHVPWQDDIDLTSDVIDVQRVAIDQTFDAPPENRQDGDTLIIPVIQEVLVLTRRYRVIEELHITRQQRTESVHVDEIVRHEHVVVDIPDPET